MSAEIELETKNSTKSEPTCLKKKCINNIDHVVER